MMDNQDLYSAVPSSSTSFSSSSSSNSDLHPLSIGVKRRQVGEKTTQQILSIIQPTADSEDRRKEIMEYLQNLIEGAFRIKVFPFGSVPLKTYLPHGDVDLTAINHLGTGQDLAAEICSLLENEEKNNTSIQVRDVFCVPAQVRVVKSTVGGISVDISFNQTAGLCALYFLEQVDHFIGKDHLFKRSLILIKAWCYYESRILGGFHGLISTYALETMILHVINVFHSSLHCPLAVLYKFLEYYSTFDWKSYCIGINGLVLISSLPEIVVHPPHDCNELLLMDDFLRSSREAILSSAGVVDTKNRAFPIKFLNILDPLRDDNNLGRCVSKGNFYRIKSALFYGTQKLSDILMLPSEEISRGLEKFFKTTLERNGKGTRADVLGPVSAYGAESTEPSSTNNNSDNLLSDIQNCSLFHDYGMMYPVPQNASATCQVWSNGWLEMGHNARFDQDTYYNADGSPPSSVERLMNFGLTDTASVEESWKSRGTGPYIPNLEHLVRKTINLGEHEKEQETEKEVETADSKACTLRDVNLCSDEGVHSCIFNLSMEDFPLLPGSKPITIKLGQLSPNCEQVKETSASLDCLEFKGLKDSSPGCGTLSEAGKQSDSEASVVDVQSNPVVAVEDQESSKNEEKMVVPVQPLQLTDEKEFPPLSHPVKPQIVLSKKEFPPLGACLRSQKRNKSKKDFKEMQKRP